MCAMCYTNIKTITSNKLKKLHPWFSCSPFFFFWGGGGGLVFCSIPFLAHNTITCAFPITAAGKSMQWVCQSIHFNPHQSKFNLGFSLCILVTTALKLNYAYTWMKQVPLTAKKRKQGSQLPLYFSKASIVSLLAWKKQKAFIWEEGKREGKRKWEITINCIISDFTQIIALHQVNLAFIIHWANVCGSLSCSPPYVFQAWASWPWVGPFSFVGWAVLEDV